VLYTHSGSCRWHLTRKTNQSETHVMLFFFYFCECLYWCLAYWLNIAKFCQ
jgi:hypothetical protein